jgi:Double zinc ribbon
VLEPILRPETGGRGTGDEGRGADEGEDPDDDLSPQAVALRALKEIEFDRATGKLSDADYETLKARYTSEALAALRSEAGTRDEGRGTSLAPAVPRPSSPVPRPACPTHGPRPESDAQFCSECGSRLASAPGYCARCGTSLERDARYCHSCGARVAA